MTDVTKAMLALCPHALGEVPRRLVGVPIRSPLNARLTPCWLYAPPPSSKLVTLVQGLLVTR